PVDVDLLDDRHGDRKIGHGAVVVKEHVEQVREAGIALQANRVVFARKIGVAVNLQDASYSESRAGVGHFPGSAAKGSGKQHIVGAVVVQVRDYDFGHEPAVFTPL